tara:strand:+ start:194 stop:493 length:300 start_codon:yes stop_codon:yes gene_type:complete
VKAHCISNDLDVDHTIPTESMRELATEFASKKPIKDSIEVQTYYKVISDAEKKLTMQRGSHDEGVLQSIKYLHKQYFEFYNYPYLRSFITTNLADFLGV